MRTTKEYMDLYTDYLISLQGQATATGLSKIVEELSHDQITRFLRKEEFNSKELWKEVKKVVREIEDENGVLIFDDTIQEKKWTKENEIICWHYDHKVGKAVKGVNILNCLYYNEGISIPVGYEIIKKDVIYEDKETKQKKRKASKTKNEMMREMFIQAIKNHIKFKYVLMDSWFSAKENFEYIRKKKKHFISAIKSNRLFATSLENKLQGRFERVDKIDKVDEKPILGYIKGYEQPVLLYRQIFKNKDGSVGVIHLVCSDTTLDKNQITTIYQKRWKVEEYHKSLKHNVNLSKSPTKIVKTQANHIFLSILAFFKLETLKIKHHLNHFALKTKLWIKANMAAFQELQRLKSA